MAGRVKLRVAGRDADDLDFVAGVCFKIKRPDYGSGQLERDLIFYSLKIV
jgi:hypothetical protein